MKIPLAWGMDIFWNHTFMIYIPSWTTKKHLKPLSMPLHSKLKKIQDLHRNLRTFQGLPLKFEVFSRLCRPCAIPNHFTISLIVKAGPHVTIATVSFSHVKTTYYFYVLRYHVLRKGTPGMSLVFYNYNNKKSNVNFIQTTPCTLLYKISAFSRKVFGKKCTRQS